MVQKEVMKKTRTYGLIAMLLAVLCVAMIYSYGTTPGIGPLPFPSVSSSNPPSNAPNGTPNPSVSNTPGTAPTPSPFPASTPEPDISPMKTFSSISELQSFLNSSGSNGGYSYYTATDTRGNGLTTASGAPIPAPTSAPPQSAVSSIGSESATKDFSTTNIQVAGVDEADTVKTDGKYLYVIGNNSQVVYILDANPQSAKVISKIFLNNTNLSGVYLSQDGTKLAVLGNQYVPYEYYTKLDGGYATGLIMPPYWSSGTTFVKVYDVSNKANPVLARNFTMTGSYVNSRLIGNYLYDIVTESAYLVDNKAVLPAVFSGPDAYSIEPSKIYYANTSDTYYTYTTIIAMNIMNNAAAPTNKTIMMGGAGNIYVSQSNIYVTCPVTNYETITTNTPAPTTASSSSSTSKPADGISIMPPIMIRPTWMGTAVYRIHVAGDTMTFAAQGNVTGNVLNQYAMDESNGYFRIVTTSYEYAANSWSGTQQNNVYVLDMTLKTVGKLEKLGTGENFHSARFMGSRCYLVTFLKTDPLFVIDLSAPTNPKLLGELIIPGYSDYLHPYDETHLIGLGKDAVASSQGGFAWYQGLKLSLFDVANVNAPREIASYKIGDRGTSSEALYDPKAFLFDASKNLLVIPVDLYLILPTTTTQYPKSTSTPSGATIMPAPLPTIIGGDSASQYGTFVWQGAYIFNVSVNGGFVLRGNVSQLDNAAAILANPSLLTMSSYQWMNYNQFINRAVYISNVLYTFSQSRVQLNSLDNFALIAKVELN